ncbi:MAG: hypothetical protein ACYTXA_02195 [Nostoc sp.]
MATATRKKADESWETRLIASVQELGETRLIASVQELGETRLIASVHELGGFYHVAEDSTFSASKVEIRAGDDDCICDQCA